MDEPRPITHGQARALVMARINAEPIPDPFPDHPSPMPQPEPCVVLDEATEERAWGWVFYYQSELYVRTGDVLDALAGNAPYLVTRWGEVRMTGTARPTEEYVAEFEAELAAR